MRSGYRVEQSYNLEDFVLPYASGGWGWGWAGGAAWAAPAWAAPA